MELNKETLKNLEEKMKKDLLNVNENITKIKILSKLILNNKCFINNYKNLIKEILDQYNNAKNILNKIEKVKIEAFEFVIKVKEKEKLAEKLRLKIEAAKIKAAIEAEINRKKQEEKAKLARLRAEKEAELERERIRKEKEERERFVKGDWFWPQNNNSIPNFYKRNGLYVKRFGGWGGNDPLYNKNWREWIINSSDKETLFLMTNWAPKFKSHNLTSWNPPLDFLVPYRGKGANFYGQKNASNHQGQYFVSGNIWIGNRWCHTYWVSAKGHIFSLNNKTINNFRWGMGFSLSATVSRVYCNKLGVRGELDLTKYLKKAIFRFTGYNNRDDLFKKTNGKLLLEVTGTSWMNGWNKFTNSGKFSHIDYEKISDDNISGEVNIPVIIYSQ